MSYRPCPEVNEGCKYFQDGCYQDEHHMWWPRKNYKSGIEKTFRNLPEHRQMLCRAEHDELHATELTPKKPSRNEMLQAIANIAIQEAS